MTTTQEIYLERSAQAAAKAHADTNHLYNGNLPYGFHLELSANVGNEFDHLLKPVCISDFVDTGHEDLGSMTLSFEAIVKLAIWWHDSIEDARLTYNDLKKIVGKKAADVVYAVTNNKGRNRNERADDKYYAGIVSTQGATYVKLCDRIANIRFGILTGSGMVDMYRKEYNNFAKKLNYSDDHELKEMFDCLKALLGIVK